MGVRDKVRSLNGIMNFIHKFDIGEPRNKSFRAKDEQINNLLIKFLVKNGLPYKKNNRPSYKGAYQPVMDNAVTVQEHFSKFVNWVRDNYEELPK